jgi:uncharacterized membrane protein
VKGEPVEQRDLSSAERGGDLSRIGAFSDGVFAIAITLLVLQLEVPGGIESDSGFWDAFSGEAADFYAFTISFAVIGRFWFLHHRFMQMIREFDSGLIGLNMVYLFFVVLIPFTSELMGDYGNGLTATVFIYIANIALVTFSAALMYVHAGRSGLARPEFQRMVHLGGKAAFFISGVFIVTMPLAIWLGPYTPLVWFPLLRLNPYQRSRRKVSDGPPA